MTPTICRDNQGDVFVSGVFVVEVVVVFVAVVFVVIVVCCCDYYCCCHCLCCSCSFYAGFTDMFLRQLNCTNIIYFKLREYYSNGFFLCV